MRYWNHEDSRYVGCLSGACLFARKTIIQKLDGFDENIFMYADEVDLCYRIEKQGYKIYYLATEEVYHLQGASSKKKSQEFFSVIMQRESNYYFFNKHHGKARAYLYRAVYFIGSLFRLLVIALSILTPCSGKRNVSTQHKIKVFQKYWNTLLWSIGLKK